MWCVCVCVCLGLPPMGITGGGTVPVLLGPPGRRLPSPMNRIIFEMVGMLMIWGSYMGEGAEPSISPLSKTRNAGQGIFMNLVTLIADPPRYLI